MKWFFGTMSITLAVSFSANAEIGNSNEEGGIVAITAPNATDLAEAAKQSFALGKLESLKLRAQNVIFRLLLLETQKTMIYQELTGVNGDSKAIQKFAFSLPPIFIDAFIMSKSIEHTKKMYDRLDIARLNQAEADVARVTESLSEDLARIRKMALDKGSNVQSINESLNALLGTIKNHKEYHEILDFRVDAYTRHPVKIYRSVLKIGKGLGVIGLPVLVTVDASVFTIQFALSNSDLARIRARLEAQIKENENILSDVASQN